MKIDVFAHVFTPKFYAEIKSRIPDIDIQIPHVTFPSLTNLDIRREHCKPDSKQIISAVNISLENFFDGDTAAELCFLGNEELVTMVKTNDDLFYGAVAMVPMNNVPKAIEIITEQVAKNDLLLGIQLFTSFQGKTFSNEEYQQILEKMHEIGKPIWIHPVFDERKPGNNFLFSWEYELSVTMMEIVHTQVFTKFPDIKIIVHHAGAMVPFFSERIIMVEDGYNSEDYKKFYVDTSIFGNKEALELSYKYYGVDHLLYGTDSPFGLLPAGESERVITAIESMNIEEGDREKIYSKNILALLNK